MPLLVTLDTNVIGKEKKRSIEEAVQGLDIELVITTVTRREQSNATVNMPKIIYETAVWDESFWGEAVWGSDTKESFVLDETALDEGVLGSDDGDPLETILTIIGSGSFPRQGQRDILTHGQRNQLRDAMILEAHIREGRDILVSDDLKAFGGDKKQTLERTFGVRLMSSEIFIEFCKELRATEVEK